MSNFWDFIWASFFVFLFVAYLMILFNIIGDLFRDHALNGWWKAVWIVFLVIAPYLTAFIYLVARGPSMAKRSLEHEQQQREAARQYVRELAGTSSGSGAASEITQAKALLDSGAITEAEFAGLKAKALA